VVSYLDKRDLWLACRSRSESCEQKFYVFTYAAEHSVGSDTLAISSQHLSIPTGFGCERILECAQSVKFVRSRVGAEDERLYHVMIHDLELVPRATRNYISHSFSWIIPYLRLIKHSNPSSSKKINSPRRWLSSS
jgi:hypothetical protein